MNNFDFCSIKLLKKRVGLLFSPSVANAYNIINSIARRYVIGNSIAIYAIYVNYIRQKMDYNFRIIV